MDTKKVEAVSNFPVPKDVKPLHSFLGLASYYCRFILVSQILPIRCLPSPRRMSRMFGAMDGSKLLIS